LASKEIEKAMVLTLMILAGGIGSRFGGEKQKAGFGPHNRSLPEYAMLHAHLAGFEKIVLVIAEGQKDAWIEFLSNKLSETGFTWKDITLAEQAKPEQSLKRQKPWGTGHALLSGIRLVSGNFMMINGDDYYGKGAYVTMAEALKQKLPHSGLLLPYKIEQTLSEYGTVSRAICEVDTEGHLTGIKETHGLQRPLSVDKNLPVSMNCWGLDSGITGELEKLFNEFLSKHPGKNEEFGIPSALESMIKKDNYSIRVLPAAEGWFGVTYREDIELVNQKLTQLERNTN
jgi:NDP-sugar pyrophosphorylase family protein